MDYEQKYKHALDLAKQVYDATISEQQKENISIIFPELRESEDERIRKEILEYFQQFENEELRGINISDWIAWLKKQGGQKLQGKTALETINEEKIDNANYVKSTDKVKPKFHKGDWVVVSTTKGDRVVQIASVEYLKDGCPSYITTEGRWFDNGTKARLLTNKDVEITTIPENRAIVNKIKSWSEEDEKIINKLIAVVELYYGIGDDSEKQICLSWLKSLKQRMGWKPSDEQMKALHDMNLTGNISYAGQGQTLIELYNDLKKL